MRNRKVEPRPLARGATRKQSDTDKSTAAGSDRQRFPIGEWVRLSHDPWVSAFRFDRTAALALSTDSPLTRAAVAQLLERYRCYVSEARIGTRIVRGDSHEIDLLLGLRRLGLTYSVDQRASYFGRRRFSLVVRVGDVGAWTDWLVKHLSTPANMEQTHA